MSPQLDLSATRGRLHALAGAGVLDRAELDRALTETDHRPTRASWAAYLDWHALIVGVVLLAAGTIFFVAANWSALPGLARLAIVGAAMIGATLVGGYLGESLAGRATSMLGGLLFGPVLAVYGQIYQTGADAWQLFAWWTGVLVAYGVLVRFAGIWVVALLGLHITGFAWIDQELGGDSYADVGAFVVVGLALIDALLVGLAERFTSGREREVATHTAAMAGLAVLLPFGVLAISDDLQSASHQLGALVLLAALAAIWMIYRWRRPALGMLAAFASVITILVSTLFARILFDGLDAELFGVAALGVVICLQVWGFTRWLLDWRREHAGVAR